MPSDTFWLAIVFICAIVGIIVATAIAITYRTRPPTRQTREEVAFLASELQKQRDFSREIMQMWTADRQDERRLAYQEKRRLTRMIADRNNLELETARHIIGLVEDGARVRFRGSKDKNFIELPDGTQISQQSLPPGEFEAFTEAEVNKGLL